MRDVRTTRAACGEICVSRARERAVLGSFPKRKPARRATRNANSHAHIWIRINSTSSTTYQQFSAKPLKINEASYPSAQSRIRFERGLVQQFPELFVEYQGK